MHEMISSSLVSGPVLLAGPIVHTMTMTGGFDVDDSACCSSAAVGRGSAGLAAQQVMGLLPKRRTGLRGRGLACTASGRATVEIVSCFLRLLIFYYL